MINEDPCHRLFGRLEGNQLGAGLSLGLSGGGSDAPVLALDFLSGETLDPRISFTRPSPATRVNASGLIETVASNVARFDYDPVTLAPQGLLIEEQRTNLFTYSAALDNAAWAKTRAAISANALASPDGTMAADKIVEDGTASSSHFVSRSFAATNGTAYTVSGFFKAAGRNWVIFQFGSTGGVFDGETASFDIANGAIGTLGAGITASIENWGNGWYRCAVTKTSGATASGSLVIALGGGANGLAYSGDGSSGIYAWGLQLEAGSFASSYIPTTAASAVRNADQPIISGTNFSSWFNPVKGAVFFEIIPKNSSKGISKAIMAIYLSSTSVDFMQPYINTSSSLFLIIRKGNINQSLINAGQIIDGQISGAEMNFLNERFSIKLNSYGEVANLSGEVPYCDIISLGWSPPQGGLYLNGNLRYIKITS